MRGPAGAVGLGAGSRQAPKGDPTWAQARSIRLVTRRARRASRYQANWLNGLAAWLSTTVTGEAR
jgi:hypothetical protein